METTLDIIIPTRFRPNIVQVCLDSIYQYTTIPFRVIAVQDGEDKEMSEMLANYQDIELIKNKESLGWVKAINQGMKIARSSYVMFLNDDVVATPKWAEKMIEHFNRISDLGLISCTTNRVDQYSKQHINYNTEEIFEENYELTGFCLLFKKKVLDKLKDKNDYWLDEKFGMGGQEDVDITRQVKLLGYKAGIARDVFIYHYGSKSFREIMTTEQFHIYAKSRVDILKGKYPEYERPKVFIAIPTIRGHYVTGLTQYLFNIAKNPNFDITLYTPQNLFPLPNARNHCVKKFLESDCNYFLSIDDDIIPPTDALERLISANKDIIGATCFSYRVDETGGYTYPVTLRYNEDKDYVMYIGQGVDEVDATGGAFILFRRRVFEHPLMERPYEDQFYRDGTLKLTGDFVVHQKAQAAGFKIFIDFNLICSHIREMDLKAVNDMLVMNQKG